MKNSVLVQFKIDPAIKKQADDLLSDLGLDIPTLLRMCLNQVVIQHKVPFEIGLSNQNVTTNPDPILKENSVTKTLEEEHMQNNPEESKLHDDADEMFEKF